jgi:hypothetical protein
MLLYDCEKFSLNYGELVPVSRQSTHSKSLAAKVVKVENPMSATVPIPKNAKSQESVTDNLPTCPICQKEFTPARSDAVYCSVRCG